MPQPSTKRAQAPSRLQLVFDAAGWTRIKGLEARLQTAFEATLEALPPSLRQAAMRVEVALLLTSNTAVQQLNHDFRGMDKPTNVLSFPQMSRRALTSAPGKGPLFLGDIAVAYQYMVDEARKDDKILIDHVTHLIIHGVLHLFGYNHETDPTARVMERLELRVMASLGLDDPYAALSTGGSARRQTRPRSTRTHA